MKKTNKNEKQGEKSFFNREYEAEYYVKLIELLQALSVNNTQNNASS